MQGKTADTNVDTDGNRDMHVDNYMCVVVKSIRIPFKFSHEEKKNGLNIKYTHSRCIPKHIFTTDTHS